MNDNTHLNLHVANQAQRDSLIQALARAALWMNLARMSEIRSVKERRKRRAYALLARVCEEEQKQQALKRLGFKFEEPL